MTPDELEALEQRLLPSSAKGTPDEFWEVTNWRTALAASDDGLEKQHLTLASLFAGRAFQAGERDAQRLATYLALFENARAKRCFPAHLEMLESRMSAAASPPDTQNS